MYCNQEIIMGEETGKWLPYNKDGVRMTAGLLLPLLLPLLNNGQKQQQETPITVHQLKIWLARLEIAEVHIDINSILNPKKMKRKNEGFGAVE